MREEWTEIWRFGTAHLLVLGEVTDESDDPADSFDNPDDIAAIRDGLVHWFAARVRVLLRDEHEEFSTELGSDYLGGCAYKNPLDLFRCHAKLTKLRRAALHDYHSNIANIRYLRTAYHGCANVPTEIARRMARNRALQTEIASLNRELANNAQLDPHIIYLTYGPSMVRCALAEARQSLAKLRSIPLRANANASASVNIPA